MDPQHRADHAAAEGGAAHWTAALPSLEVEGERLVLPSFDGRGLANVAPTILHLLGRAAGDGQAETGLPPLDPAVLPPRLAEGVRAVVLLVADGLGHLQLLREAEAGNAPNLARLLRQAASEPAGASVAYAPVTSVFPTTTVAALGSLNSAVPPAEHGLLGYTLYLEEFGQVAEMIRWGPLERRGSYADATLGGASPEGFFWSPTLYRRLAERGVERAFAVNPAHFHGTALTRMLHQGARYVGYAATSSLGPAVARILDEQPAGAAPTYIYAYWPGVDSVTHLQGPRSEEHAAEVAALDLALGRLLDRLPARGDTLLLLTADHGHQAVAPERIVRLDQVADLQPLLACPPAGERRAVYLHARPGRADDLAACVRAHLGEHVAVLTREDAEARGVFGPRGLEAHPRARARVGDLLLFPRGGLQLVYELPPGEGPVPPEERPRPAPDFRGMHGGLTPDEALVPLLSLRV